MTLSLFYLQVAFGGNDTLCKKFQAKFNESSNHDKNFTLHKNWCYQMTQPATVQRKTAKNLRLSDVFRMATESCAIGKHLFLCSVGTWQKI